MHTLLRVTMTDVGMANDAIMQGKIETIFKETNNLIKPESTFFYTDRGFRTALFVFDLKDAAMIPQVAEPFFTQLNAQVEMFPAMNPMELSKGLEAWKINHPREQSLS